MPGKRKITLDDWYGEVIEEPRQIETKFREVWKKVFCISEEEEEQFDEDHEDLIRDRMAPLIDRIIPFETTDENRFNGTNSKITTEKILKMINEKVNIL